MKHTEKLLFIDYIRTFSMLYIVGYWHLFNYTDFFPGYKNRFTTLFTCIVLGVFTLISGFLAAKSVKNSTTIMAFCKKKLIRIYPLYFLATLLFFAYGLNEALTTFRALLLTSMFYTPTPTTLWFISMLTLFYLTTPFLAKIAEQTRKRAFLITILISLFLALIIFNKALNDQFDVRILMYFPCFFAGIYCAHHGITNQLFNFRSAIVFLITGVILYVVKNNNPILDIITRIVFILSCSYLIFSVAHLKNDKFIHLNIISFLSYSSYAMYLFHRPIYITLKALYFPKHGILQMLYLILICFTTVSLISWKLQQLYDHLLQQLTNTTTRL